MMSRWVWAGAFAIVCVAVGLTLTLTSRNRNEDRSTAYPSMASIEQYLMPDRNAEIALARSAAPQSISSDAKILVLGWRGYETAIEGKNGFVCMVERSWTSPFNSAEFWNPKVRVPICFNPAAARSILPLTIKRTEMVLAGMSKAQMIDSIKAGFDNKELPAPEPGAMCYMMSRAGYLNDALGHFVPHLMFYFPADGQIFLGCGSARLASHAESAVSGWSGAHHRVRDSGWQMVGWNGCTGYVGMSRSKRKSAIWPSHRAINPASEVIRRRKSYET